LGAMLGQLELGPEAGGVGLQGVIGPI
jgi:hypothetical protein